MRFAYRITNSRIKAPSQIVIIIAFPRQQWLRVNASMLCSRTLPFLSFFEKVCEMRSVLENFRKKFIYIHVHARVHVIRNYRNVKYKKDKDISIKVLNSAVRLEANFTRISTKHKLVV